MDPKRPDPKMRPMGPPPEEDFSKPSNANAITRRYFDSILIEERLIDAKEASLDTEILGSRFSTPIMMPAFSHLKRVSDKWDSGMLEYVRAAKSLNMLNWVGMMENDEFEEIMAVGVPTVRIIKPYADRDKVLDQIEFAEKLGAFAVGMDIDHIFGNDGGYDLIFGEPMARQTIADIESYVNATKLPFVIKGILSASDAKKCVGCGVKGLLVSHHHGRLPYAVPPLMVLPEILKAVSGSGAEVFVDCGIDSGADAYKALAMGATAVATGRAILQPLIKEGQKGVEAQIKKMNAELKMLMNYTGCAKTSEMNPDVLWIGGKRLAP